MLTPSAHVILHLTPRQGRNPETRFASRIKWDGDGGILIYDAAYKLADRVPLSAVEKVAIEPFRAHRPPSPIQAAA
jgi:hypothetical protein